MSSPLLDNACYVKAIVLYPVLRLLFPIFQTPRKKKLSACLCLFAVPNSEIPLEMPRHAIDFPLFRAGVVQPVQRHHLAIPHRGDLKASH